MLSEYELVSLVKKVFGPQPDDRVFTIITDVPVQTDRDRPEWAERRFLAAEWARILRQGLDDWAGNSLHVRLVAYPDVGKANADLPELAHEVVSLVVPDVAADLAGHRAISFEEVFRTSSIILAPTEFSTTAPLSMAARKHGFRGATMPGFVRGMMPALKLDYGVIHRRCMVLKQLLDEADGATLTFETELGQHRLFLDLRHRTAHASSGLQTSPGRVGNLPSGETYMTPYEGEKPDEPSLSAGELPVEFSDGLVVYLIQGNRAVDVRGEGPAKQRELDTIRTEPAYANIAELGLGILDDFGVQPLGEILLDEKLGLHVAFGRSDHFGGIVGPSAFTSPSAVVHIDRVYLPSTQPRVMVKAVNLHFGKRVQNLMAGTRYVLDPKEHGW